MGGSRHKRALFKDAGLIDVALELLVIQIHEYALGNQLLALEGTVLRAQEAGVIGAAEGAQWLAGPPAGQRRRAVLLLPHRVHCVRSQALLNPVFYEYDDHGRVDGQGRRGDRCRARASGERVPSHWRVQVHGSLSPTCTSSTDRRSSGRRVPFHECPEEAWERVLSVNLKGIWLCIQHEIRQMLFRGAAQL
jgi:hypothetical protein